jgi:LPXTG-motif cell wall-anchored protein
LLVLGFGLAMVWLSRHLGWLVLAALAWSAVIETIAVTEPRDSLFGGTYRAYQVLNTGDAITFGLVIAGALCLALLALGLIAGRWRSGLAADRLERARS